MGNRTPLAPAGNPTLVGITALALAVVGVPGSPVDARAQIAERVAPGSRVRVDAAGLFPRPTIAAVAGWRGDSLLLELPGGTARPVALAAIRRLDISRGRTSKVVTGAGLGLAVGAAATAVFLSVFCADPDTSCQADEFARAFTIIALPPTAVGALIGLTVRTERWTSVPLPPGSPGGRIRAGLSLNW